MLVANEAIDAAKRKKKKCLFFKVDYEKAYDSFNWDFLRYMMKRLGFSEKWIKWIYGCLQSSRISVLKVNFNKSSFGTIGVDEVTTERYTNLLNCRVLNTPFVYLGIPIGANPRLADTWSIIYIVQEFFIFFGWGGGGVETQNSISCGLSVLNQLNFMYLL